MLEMCKLNEWISICLARFLLLNECILVSFFRTLNLNFLIAGKTLKSSVIALDLAIKTFETLTVSRLC